MTEIQENTEILPKLNNPTQRLPHHKGISIDEIVHLIEVEGLTMAQTARRLNCDKSNITDHLKRNNITPGYLKHYKEHRADILANYQHKLLKSISIDKLKKASFSQLVVGFGILFDKERLERGESVNVNNQHLTLIFNELPKDVAEGLKAKLLAMLQGKKK